MSTPAARDRLILALDVDSPQEAMKVASLLSSKVGVMKIGPGLFVDGGKGFIEDLKAAGYGIFLDFKLYDIPETVARACRRIGLLGVDFLTVHASGGSKMMMAAAAALRESSPGPKRTRLLAVTVLTSFDAEQFRAEWGMDCTIAERVAQLARMARDSSMDGIVCSPLELETLGRDTGGELLRVVPGIRLPADPTDDQRRTLTPGEAVALGADYIVVGRPILKSADPVRAAETILGHMKGGKHGTR